MEGGVDVGVLPNVEFVSRDWCAARENHTEGASQPAHLTTDAQAFIECDRIVFEGDRFRVGRIEFSGNTKTQDKVIRREFLLYEGTT